MSDVNFDRYPSCLSWQVLNKNRGRTADRTCSITFTIKPCPVFSILFCIFHIITIWSRKKSGNRCDLKKIKYNKVNSDFLLHDQFQRSELVLFAQGVSVQGVNVLGGKCPGGKCPGGICPRGIFPRGVSVSGVRVQGVSVGGGGV